MWVGAVFIVVIAGPYVAAKEYFISVGYLPCISGDFRYRQGPSISGAFSMAIDDINQSTEILPNITLLMQWGDTQCNNLVTTRLFTKMICSWVVAFFGPEEICETAGIISQSRNLPMISHKCTDYQDYSSPSFVRLDPSAAKMTKSVISLLRYYKWHKFSILYEESYATAALTLENDAKMMNMTLNHRRPVDDSWTQIIMDTKPRTRIYVFIGSTSELVEMMNAMEAMGMFVLGEYMVIFADMIPYWPKDPLDYLLRKDRMVCPKSDFKKRAQSLLVVVSSEPVGKYEDFAKKVHEYNSKKPFEFPFSPFGNKVVSIQAAYLYDSVKLYATALHKLIEEETIQINETLNFKKLMNIATDGSRIVSKMVALTPFQSVTGSVFRLDEHADADGNYTVLAYKPLNQALSSPIRSDFNCSHSMVPVSSFNKILGDFPSYVVNPRLPVEWPLAVKPTDEPLCGYSNENC